MDVKGNSWKESMKKFIISIIAVMFMVSPAFAGQKKHHHNNHNNYNQYNCYNCKKKNNNNSGDVALGILGGVIGGMVLGEILEGPQYPAYPEPVYPAYEVPPLSCWYKHIQVWDEEFQQYILIKKRVCSQY